MSLTDPKIAYQGELQLLAWSETNTRGQTVTFQVNETEHPFKDATTKSGRRSGQRYVAVFVLLGDDERPVERTPSQIAFLLCQDEQFWHFCNERSFATIDSEESAKFHICETCGISSRSELDTNLQARSTWLTQFYNPWTAHKAALDKRLLGAAA